MGALEMAGLFVTFLFSEVLSFEDLRVWQSDSTGSVITCFYRTAPVPSQATYGKGLHGRLTFHYSRIFLR